MIRMIIVSTHLGANPATRPTDIPPIEATVTTTSPTRNE